ncbi:ATP-binding protein [Rhodococcus koreensis]|uniref:PAS domain-containing hybrid sensor histidine kinase/response regulator n=1 Tax=Rhodococcus koreensis TaxID=99653 RepID=UPI00366AE4BC
MTALAVLERTPSGWRVTLANRSCTDLLGNEYRSVLVDASEDIGRAVARVCSSRSGGLVAELHHRRILVKARPLDKSDDLYVVEFHPVSDILARESELRSEVRQLQNLVDNCTAMMYIKGIDGRYIAVNTSFGLPYGRAKEEIIGRTDKELFPESLAETYMRNDQHVLTTGRAIEIEEPYGDTHGHIDTRRRWLSIKFPLLDDAGVPYALGGISTDITDRKRAEIAARDARIEAERANRSKDEFVSRMSHELRTPLNAILGFAQLLRTQTLPPDAAEQVEHILDAGNHLATLVNDTLDISWIEAGAPGMTVTTVAAATPIHEALEIIRPLAVATGIEIASDLHQAMHQAIRADPQRLRQVLLNLLSNAVKFNRPRGFVRISCRVDEGKLRYRITDTGEGLSETDAQQVFKPFARLSGTADVEGSGLGLSLARRFAERMGGAVGIERTAPGEGSTFFVDMPLAANAPQTPPPPVVAEAVNLPQVAAAKVVQIDDVVANQRLIESILTKMGCTEVHSAATGEEGWELVRQVRPDVIILDFNLPDITGLDLLARFRGDDDFRTIPILVLSADTSPDRVESARTLGISDFVGKPIDIGQFATALVRALAADRSTGIETTP